MTFIIDGDKINSLEGFYDQIEKYLIRGECPWGRNLDSLEEIVHSNFNYTDVEALSVKEIIWTQAAVAEEKLGTEATIEWLSDKLKASSSSEYQKQIQQRIMQVTKGQEPTLFEMLKQILSSNDKIKLTLN